MLTLHGAGLALGLGGAEICGAPSAPAGASGLALAAAGLAVIGLRPRRQLRGNG